MRPFSPRATTTTLSALVLGALLALTQAQEAVPTPAPPNYDFSAAGAGGQPVFAPEPLDTLESPAFPDPEYVRLLDYSLLFFEAQRSGTLPPDQRVKWRGNSALNDGRDVGLDLSGGYYDAGDYLKLIFPLTFSMTQVCWAGIEFFDGFQLANQTKHLNSMVRWGMDWLIKAHPNNNTLYVQVGTAEIDHSYWGPDTNIPLPRPAFAVTNLRPGTDAVADAASAFASCSVLYRERLNDTAYANTLQTHADSLFRFAETAKPQQTYQTAIAAAACCYESRGFVDDLAFAAAWMYRLTKESTFLTKATQYIGQLNVEYTRTDPITWDEKTPLVYILMAGATAGTPAAVKWQEMAEKFAGKTADTTRLCQFTKGGLYFCKGDSDNNSAAVSANAAMALQLLSSQMGKVGTVSSENKAKIDRYNDFALKQVNYLLGNNPMKTPYIVGVHPNSPINPHSASASGGNGDGDIDTVPEREKYVHYGAMVGGPDQNDRFRDKRSEYKQTEVAMDYNAPFTGLMAYQVMTSKLSPPYVVIPAGRPDMPPMLLGMEIWKFILIVVGVLFVLIAIGAFVCYRKRDQIRAWRARRSKKHPAPSTYSLAKPPRTMASAGSSAAAVNLTEYELEGGPTESVIPHLGVTAAPPPPPRPSATGLNATESTAPHQNITSAPPPPPRPRSTVSNEQTLTNSNSNSATSTVQSRRPVPPPPLPTRRTIPDPEDPILLANAPRV